MKRWVLNYMMYGNCPCEASLSTWCSFSQPCTALSWPCGSLGERCWVSDDLVMLLLLLLRSAVVVVVVAVVAVAVTTVVVVVAVAAVAVAAVTVSAMVVLVSISATVVAATVPSVRADERGGEAKADDRRHRHGHSQSHDEEYLRGERGTTNEIYRTTNTSETIPSSRTLSRQNKSWNLTQRLL